MKQLKNKDEISLWDFHHWKFFLEDENITPRVLKEILNLPDFNRFNRPIKSAKELVIHHDKMTPDLLTWYYHKLPDSSSLKEEILKSDKAPVSLLMEALKSENVSLKAAALKNPNIKSKDLIKDMIDYALDTSDFERIPLLEAILKNPQNLDEQDLYKIFQSEIENRKPNEDILGPILKATKNPQKYIDKFPVDSLYSLKSFLSNPHLDQKTLEKFLALHPNINSSVINDALERFHYAEPLLKAYLSKDIDERKFPLLLRIKDNTYLINVWKNFDRVRKLSLLNFLKYQPNQNISKGLFLAMQAVRDPDKEVAETAKSLIKSLKS